MEQHNSHQFTIYRSVPVYLQRTEISSPAAAWAVLRSALGRVGKRTRGEAGGGRPAARARNQCLGKGVANPAAAAEKQICFVCVCDSAGEVQVNGPVKKGELKQITYPKRDSAHRYFFCQRR